MINSEDLNRAHLAIEYYHNCELTRSIYVMDATDKAAALQSAESFFRPTMNWKRSKIEIYDPGVRMYSHEKVVPGVTKHYKL